jgi:hypothetical protein
MSIDVTISEMQAHANRLDGIADQARRGLDAARSVSCHGDAFGILCAFIGAQLTPVEEEGVAMPRLATGGIEGTAEMMRDLARLFQATDEVVGDVFSVFKGSA